MKERIFTAIIFLICLLITFSCGNDDSITEKIIGKWERQRVTELSEDVTQNHNPGSDRWIRFKKDAGINEGGTFESGSGDKKENTGKWIYDKKENELFIDSNAGEDDDSYWDVTIEDNTMQWEKV
jgi:hypothetical protein